MLKEKVIKSLSWSFFSQLSREGLRFVISMVLARLLSPKDFGLVSMSETIINFILIFNTLGFRPALIQRSNIKDIHYNTAFWTSVLLGVILLLITLSISKLISGFFNEPILRKIVCISAIGFIVNPLNTIQFAILEKSLEFKRITIIEVLRTIISGIVSISLAITGYGVWSLVLGGIVAQTLIVPVTWRMTEWRPSLAFKKEAFRELFGFGANLTGSAVINYFARNADNLIIGKYLGATALGYYSLAYNLMLKPLQYVSANLGRVLFPAFSIIKDNKVTARNIYLKLVQFISLITFPMMTGLLFVAPEAVAVVYGTKWLPVVPVLQILCIIGAIDSIGTTVGLLYMSQGRADLQFKYTLIFTPIMVASFFIGVNWGIIGVAIGYAIASGGLWIWSHVVANRLIDLRLKPLFVQLLPATFASVGMYALLFFIKFIQSFVYNGFSVGIILSEFVILGILIYLGLAYIIKSEAFIEAASMLKNRRIKYDIQRGIKEA